MFDDDAPALAERLTDIVVEHVTAFATKYTSAFVLPSTFAGFPIGSDVRADLAFTLGLLREAGVTTIAETPIDDAIATLLSSIDGPETHTFFSYRVAETLRRFGPFAQNSLVARWDDEQRRNVADASDSTSWCELLDAGLPANYAAVLARCEVARRSLGFDIETAVLDDLVDRTRRLITANPAGFIDDSEDGTGARYDIYSADVYLFTEPFADELQPQWDRGLRNVLDLVEDVATPDGSAMSWGRSLGVLAVCHTIELAAIALQRGLTDDSRRWLGLGANAATQFQTWTDGMLVTAHKHRSQNRYRGPDRWLQLTFDCLGKLAWAANTLRRVDTAPVGGRTTLFPERDKIVWFDEARRAGVWTYRSPGTAFLIPFVGTAWADYLPAPRDPGLYEVPVDAPLPTAVPVVVVGNERYVGGGLPTALSHVPDGVDVVWTDFPPLLPTSAEPALSARRATEFRVDRHVLTVSESLEFERVPDAVSLQVTETSNRPLRVDVATDLDHRVDLIDTDGLAVYRSFWAELPRVHQVDVAPARRVDFTWSVRPLVRIATPDSGHHYHRCLYDELSRDVIEASFGGHLVHDPERGRERLDAVDAFHLHWPEWFVETPEQADRFIDLLEHTGTALIWTQHNLRPHRDVPRADELYQRFASAARLVIHHSEWGREVVQARYAFRDDAMHVVLAHGHFGALLGDEVDRSDVERELGLPACAIRIAILGAPRREKHTRRFMDAVAATARDDLQLLVLSLDEDEEVLDDPRIFGLPYEFVDRETYNRRLAAADVLALPFDADGQMLTTGVVGDVVGSGLPAIVSDWAYLTETLGSAGMVYRSQDELVTLLESLSIADLQRAGRASAALQAEQSWPRIAEEFLDAVIASGALKG